MAQDNAGIAVSALSEKIASNLRTAARQGCVIDPNGRLYSPIIYLTELMKQVDPSVGDAERVFESIGMATVGGAIANGVLMFTPVGPLVLAGWVASMIGAPAFTNPRICTILILNELNGSLKQSGDPYIDCGLQTGHPELPNPADPANPLKGVIPGKHVFRGKNAHDTFGLGVYQFQKDLGLTIGFYGTGGALALTSDDPDVTTTIGISWLVPETGKPGCGVTTDLIGKYGSLKAFYDATAGARSQSERIDSGSNLMIHSTLFYHNFDSAVRSTPQNHDEENLAYTVNVRKG